MLSHWIHLPRDVAAVVLLGALSAVALLAAAPALADSRPQVLDTQRGISSGTTGGTELQTGPLTYHPGAGAQPMGAADGQQGNGSAAFPYIVAPYIQIGGAPSPNPPAPNPPTPKPPLRPRPTPHSP